MKKTSLRGSGLRDLRGMVPFCAPYSGFNDKTFSLGTLVAINFSMCIEVGSLIQSIVILQMFRPIILNREPFGFVRGITFHGVNWRGKFGSCAG